MHNVPSSSAGLETARGPSSRPGGAARSSVGPVPPCPRSRGAPPHCRCCGRAFGGLRAIVADSALEFGCNGLGAATPMCMFHGSVLLVVSPDLSRRLVWDVKQGGTFINAATAFHSTNELIFDVRVMVVIFRVL